MPGVLSGAVPGVILLFALGSTATAAPVTYDVDVAPDLSSLHVRFCYPSPVPEALYAGEEGSAAYLKRFSLNGNMLNLRRLQGGRVALAGEPGAACGNYEVDVFAAASGKRHPLVRTTTNSAVLLRAGTWLWLPKKRTGVGLELRVHLPEGFSFSGPWPPGAANGRDARYVLAPPHDWPALTAFGRMHEQRVPVPGAELRLAILDGTPAPDIPALQEWVRECARAVAGAYGRFPVASPQVLVVPVGRGDEAVPWGQVLRGGGSGAHLFVDQTRSKDEFREDWVLVHELSHMLHPNLNADGKWLAEGLATYYQNILRARSGALSEKEAWLKLHQGFQRGIAQTRRGETLKQATRDMMRDHIFMRVYWTGAAVAMLADVSLRLRGQSLDEVLSRFGRCCLDDGRVWSVPEFLRTLDGFSGGDELSRLYRRYIDSDDFPDLSSAYRMLGLVPAAGGLELAGDAQSAQLRGSIMQARGGSG